MRIRPGSSSPTQSSQPRVKAWRWHFGRGALWGLVLGMVVMSGLLAYVFAAAYGVGPFLITSLALLAASTLIGALLVFLGRLLGKLPTPYLWILTSFFVVYLLVLMRSVSALLGAVAAFFAVVLGLSLIGAGTVALARHPWRTMSTRERTFTVAGLALGLALLSFVGVLLTGDGKPVERHALAPEGRRLPQLTASNPALPGPYQVHTLTYGSGTDRHRAEYGEAVELTTPTFDVSPFVSGWTSLRTRYWGFGPEAVPLNATVWYPEGDGPFPLVLMVHGNAEMTRGSDQGYEYLGELRASRGYIFASVDQNFLNYSYWTDFLFFSPVTGENDARAILLLEHLKLWQAWNETPQHPFHNKVDMSRIALGGHSRGGEAVAIASVFNQVAHYSDDASIRFDYGFDIGAIFALAPTDGMYTPANRPLVIEDVDYLVLHGAHDMDVISFMGAAQYDRVQLQQDDFAFKSAVYVEHANHGQFNTVWGRNDVQRPALWLLNRAQLLPVEEQRRIAEVYVSAFLDAALLDKREYLPLFQDARVATQWLPATGYLSRYADTDTVHVSTFDEDLDPSTTTLPGGRLQGIGLTMWREGAVSGKLGTLNRHAVFLGWDHAKHTEPQYIVTLPADTLELSVEDALVFDVADVSGTSAVQPLDFSVVLMDQAGESVRLPLSEAGYGRFAIESAIAKAKWMDVLFPSLEPVFQTVSLPLSWFAERNPRFNVEALQRIILTFDGTPEGLIAVDRIGFRQAREPWEI